MKKILLVCFVLLINLNYLMFAQNKESNSESEIKKREDTLKYGMGSDVTTLLDTLIKEKDVVFIDSIYEIFINTNNIPIKTKVIQYYTELKNDKLKDYCLEILTDPYDEKNELVSAILQYVSKLEIKEAAPLVLEILKSENETFFDASLSAIGKIGGKEEADYLIEYLNTEDLAIGRKQSLMRAIGELNIVETYDQLLEIAKDSEENNYVRIYAIEALGKMNKVEIVPELINLFDNIDPNFRATIVKAVSHFDDEKSNKLILDAFKDNHATVRLQAVKVAREKKLVQCIPYLIFRANNDSDTRIKYECYYALSAIGNEECDKFLISIVENKKINDTSRAKCCDAILEYKNENCYQSIKDLATITLKDDKLKNLRYAIGKSIAKDKFQFFESTCSEYLDSKDVATQGTGLDIYQTNQYDGLLNKVKSIADSEKPNANKRKAALILEKKAMKE